MEKSTTELTHDYIKEHPHIKACLKKGLVNYSSLARLISEDLEIENKTSKEAILIAARRFKQKLDKEKSQDKKVKEILSKAEMEIKNKIVAIILEKTLNFDHVFDLQKQAYKENGTFFLIEGSDKYTLITQEKYLDFIYKNFKQKIIKENLDLALINFKTGEEIEEVTGAIAFITSLFAENGVNIVEILSCWTDNVFVIEAKDVSKSMNFLKF